MATTVRRWSAQSVLTPKRASQVSRSRSMRVSAYSSRTSVGLAGAPAGRLESRSMAEGSRVCSKVRTWRCSLLGRSTTLPSTDASRLSVGSGRVRVLLGASLLPMLSSAWDWRPVAVSIHCRLSLALAATVPAA